MREKKKGKSEKLTENEAIEAMMDFAFAWAESGLKRIGLGLPEATSFDSRLESELYLSCTRSFSSSLLPYLVFI